MWTLHEATNDKVLVLTDGVDRIHEMPWDALGSWGALLGIEDPEETLDTILTVTHEHVPVDWPALYTALLDFYQTKGEIAESGVASLEMSLELEEEEATVEEAQEEAREAVEAAPQVVRQGSVSPILPASGPVTPMGALGRGLPVSVPVEAPDPLKAAVEARADRIEAHRMNFLESFDPTYSREE